MIRKLTNCSEALEQAAWEDALAGSEYFLQLLERPGPSHHLDWWSFERTAEDPERESLENPPSIEKKRQSNKRLLDITQLEGTTAG